MQKTNFRVKDTNKEVNKRMKEDSSHKLCQKESDYTIDNTE